MWDPGESWPEHSTSVICANMTHLGRAGLGIARAPTLLALRLTLTSERCHALHDVRVCVTKWIPLLLLLLLVGAALKYARVAFGEFVSTRAQRARTQPIPRAHQLRTGLRPRRGRGLHVWAREV